METRIATVGYIKRASVYNNAMSTELHFRNATVVASVRLAVADPGCFGEADFEFLLSQVTELGRISTSC